MKKIIQAVGEIFITEGPKGLKILRIAQKAGVDRKLVYRYFGKQVDNILEAYIVEKDYWMKFANRINEAMGVEEHVTQQALIVDILQNQWRYFESDREMQALILLELSGESELMKSIHNARELMMQSVLDQTDASFAGSSVNFRSVAVLLLGGIYYANLHARYNGPIICGMDVKSAEGQQALLLTIRQIIEWAFERAK